MFARQVPPRPDRQAGEPPSRLASSSSRCAAIVVQPACAVRRTQLHHPLFDQRPPSRASCDGSHSPFGPAVRRGVMRSAPHRGKRRCLFTCRGRSAARGVRDLRRRLAPPSSPDYNDASRASRWCYRGQLELAAPQPTRSQRWSEARLDRPLTCRNIHRQGLRCIGRG